MDNPYTSPFADVDPPQRDPASCPTCGGREFREGRMSFSLFVPDSWPWLRLWQGLGLKSLACVDCGHVRNFIIKKHLDALRRS